VTTVCQLCFQNFKKQGRFLYISSKNFTKERMAVIFETFKPKNKVIATYVDYYYLDIKPTNDIAGFTCFPHFNNTISLYRSHNRMPDGTIVYDKAAKAFQIFTPVREKALQVKQAGAVHRVAIVFNPLGIQQFFRDRDFSGYITDFDFFTGSELDTLFVTDNVSTLADLLDQFLHSRYREYKNEALEQAIAYIFRHYDDFSIEDLGKELQLSRRQLVRIFKTHLGVSPKKFQQIVLFRKTMEHKLAANSSQSFTTLAYEYNFSDQAHLNKTFEKFTAHSPKQFFSKGTVLGKEDTFWHLQE